MMPLAETLWSQLVDWSNALANGPRYVGVRYLLSFFALLISAVKIVWPIFMDRRKPPDPLRQAKKEPSFEAAFTTLADTHLRLQARYEIEVERNERLEHELAAVSIEKADLVGRLQYARKQLGKEKLTIEEPPPPAGPKTGIDDSL